MLLSVLFCFCAENEKSNPVKKGINLVDVVRIPFEFAGGAWLKTTGFLFGLETFQEAGDVLIEDAGKICSYTVSEYENPSDKNSIIKK